MSISRTQRLHILQSGKILNLMLPSLFLWSSLASLSSALSLPSNYAQFGDSCDLANPCDPAQGVACISNICQCGSPSNQRYDNSSKKCVSVVGGPCSGPSIVGDLRRECISNAICSEKRDESGETYTECQCEPGYIENSSGDCVPGIGQPCSYLPHECNPLGMVVCKNGKCQCLDELQVYDVDMKRCVSPAGTHCKYERAASSLQLGCVKNAICYPFFYWIPPKCLCKPGYAQTKSRKCVPESDYYNGKHGTSQDNEIISNHNQDDSNNQRNENSRQVSSASWHTTSSATASDTPVKI